MTNVINKNGGVLHEKNISFNFYDIRYSGFI